MRHEYNFVDHTGMDKPYPYGLMIETPFKSAIYDSYNEWVDYLKSEATRRNDLLLETVGYNEVSGHYDLMFYWFKTVGDRLQFKLIL